MDSTLHVVLDMIEGVQQHSLVDSKVGNTFGETTKILRSGVVIEPTSSYIRPQDKQIRAEHPLCRGILGLIRHDWLYLGPNRAQLEEIRRLISFGEGRLGRIGTKHVDVYDRICRRCFVAESRMNRYIAALQTARGE